MIAMTAANSPSFSRLRASLPVRWGGVVARAMILAIPLLLALALLPKTFPGLLGDALIPVMILGAHALAEAKVLALVVSLGGLVPLFLLAQAVVRLADAGGYIQAARYLAAHPERETAVVRDQEQRLLLRRETLANRQPLVGLHFGTWGIFFALAEGAGFLQLGMPHLGWLWVVGFGGAGILSWLMKDFVLPQAAQTAEARIAARKAANDRWAAGRQGL